MLHHSPKIKNDVLKRLSFIIGHVKGINKMVEDDKYCIDIVKQIQAVQAALSKVTDIALENHLKTCVSHAIKKGEGQKLIKEVMETIKETKKQK